MNLGTIFYEKDYTNACDYSAQNGYTIKEITPDSFGRTFQIVEIPQPTESELAQQEIQELKQKLIDTDYVSNKLAEAVSKYIATGDNTEVVELRTKYSKQVEDRQLWRDRINELEKLL